jgi:hypothetical protein
MRWQAISQQVLLAAALLHLLSRPALECMRVGYAAGANKCLRLNVEYLQASKLCMQDLTMNGRPYVKGRRVAVCLYMCALKFFSEI